MIQPPPLFFFVTIMQTHNNSSSNESITLRLRGISMLQSFLPLWKIGIGVIWDVLLLTCIFQSDDGVPSECVQPVYRALHSSIDIDYNYMAVSVYYYYGDFNKNLSNEASRDVRGIASKTQRFGDELSTAQ